MCFTLNWNYILNDCQNFIILLQALRIGHPVRYLYYLNIKNVDVCIDEPIVLVHAMINFNRNSVYLYVFYDII